MLRRHVRVLRVAMLLTCAGLAQVPGHAVAATSGATDSLFTAFQTPPDAAKPRVWWHWMNGNISQQGIKADLEWMKRIGIGGIQNFDAAFNTPQGSG